MTQIGYIDYQLFITLNLKIGLCLTKNEYFYNYFFNNKYEYT